MEGAELISSPEYSNDWYEPPNLVAPVQVFNVSESGPLHSRPQPYKSDLPGQVVFEYDSQDLQSRRHCAFQGQRRGSSLTSQCRKDVMEHELSTVNDGNNNNLPKPPRKLMFDYCLELCHLILSFFLLS